MDIPEITQPGFIQTEIAVIGAIQAVIVAIIVGYFGRDSRNNKRTIEDAAQRIKIGYEEQFATLGLIRSLVTIVQLMAKAVIGLKLNGDLQEALEEVKKTNSKYQEYLDKVTAEHKLNN
jgi:hypothetical protein